MARAAVQRRLTWLRGTVLENLSETARVHRIVVDVPGWPGHLPGQHLDLRLTAESRCPAQRSYSIASAPEDLRLHLLVERFEGRGVSTQLTDDLRPGDGLELRGPLGGYFVWSAAADRDGERSDAGRPVQLVAGSTGVAPFLAMLDQHRVTGSSTAVRLLYAVRSLGEVLGRDTLGLQATVTVARVDRHLLQTHAFAPTTRPRIFVSGPTSFVEPVATALVDLGHDPSWIRLERFGTAP